MHLVLYVMLTMLKYSITDLGRSRQHALIVILFFIISSCAVRDLAVRILNEVMKIQSQRQSHVLILISSLTAQSLLCVVFAPALAEVSQLPCS